MCFGNYPFISQLHLSVYLTYHFLLEFGRVELLNLDMSSKDSGQAQEKKVLQACHYFQSDLKVID